MPKYKIDGDEYEIKREEGHVVITMNGAEIHRSEGSGTDSTKSVMVVYVTNVLRGRVREEERKAEEAEKRGSDLERLLESLRERWSDPLYDWRTDV